MSRIEPLAPASLSPDLAAIVAAAEQAMGFTPNDALVMARQPALLRAFGGLLQAAYAPGGRVDMELKRLVALMSSTAAGCRYCSAHVAHGAARSDVSRAKLERIWDYQQDEIFSPLEVAALDLARYASLTPNAATDEHFAALRQHLDADQIAEIVAVIALFGFLNRWNGTLATDLEASPLRVAQETGLDGF